MNKEYYADGFQAQENGTRFFRQVDLFTGNPG
jgi:hypothetical protein